DAAALAGAQDLQEVTRGINPADQTNARTKAFKVMQDRLGASGTCDPSRDWTYAAPCALPGTPFLVSVETPSPSCVTCESTHSIQVTVRNPNFALGFGALYGRTSFNVPVTSIAGLAFFPKYALATLRPPKQPNGNDNQDDIRLNGNGVGLTIP